jgi:aspartyl-tRNA(Asn)/glutamyl-tRNA(Gln) amidotransferase subunit A
VTDPTGLRIAIKDNIVTSYGTTTCGSLFLRNYKSPFTATAAQRLLSDDKTPKRDVPKIISKTNMDEFGMGSHSTHSHFGPVSNFGPFSDRSAGGSSGGSAVCVAAGTRDLALGTDTGGSVRLPAAYTGIVGFKPSYGRISRWGVIPYANSLDTVGMLASTCKELLSSFARLEGCDRLDPTSPSVESRKRFSSKIERFSDNRRENLTSLRIGVPVEYNIEELHSNVKSAWDKILRTIRSQGHTIVPVSLPSTKQALSAYYVLAAAEATSNLAKYDGIRYGTRGENNNGPRGVLYSETRGRGFGDEVKRRILLGSYTLSSEAISNYFIQAQKVRRLVQRDFDRVFNMPNVLRPLQQFDLSGLGEDIQLEDKLGPAQVDLIVCPTAPTLPPLLEEIKEQNPLDAYINDVFTVPSSLAGLPSISIPVQAPKDQRPEGNVPFAGIQVIGQYWDDYFVVAFGQVLQSLESSPEFGERPAKGRPGKLGEKRKRHLNLQ